MIDTVTSVPSNVVAIIPFDNIVDITLSPKTWCFKMSVNVGMSLSSAATVPAGKALNAASVGANKVNGPGPDNVPSNPQALIAVSKVVWSLELVTISYTEFVAGVGGNRTASITCTTPLSAIISATVTIALSI